MKAPGIISPRREVKIPAGSPQCLFKRLRCRLGSLILKLRQIEDAGLIAGEELLCERSVSLSAFRCLCSFRF